MHNAKAALATKKINDENDFPRQLMAIAAKKAMAVTAAASTTVAEPKLSIPVDQFEAFSVYQDENKLPDSNAADPNFSICSDINLSVIR